MENDSDSVDTLTSSDCSDVENPSDCSDAVSDGTLSDNGDNDTDDETESFRSLAFSVQSDRSTATVKSNKTKKRVRFKPGDKLVLVYIIPNREMLGLKSDSEGSDDSDDGDDSDDEDDDDEDDSDEETEEEDDEDEEGNEKVSKLKKPKPFAKLMAIKQVTTHKKSESKKPKPPREKPTQLINLNIASAQKTPRRNARANRRREKKERVKVNKKEINIVESKPRQAKSKRNKANAISVDIDRPKRSRRGRPGFLEIKATVQGNNKQETTASVPRMVYRNDLKPNVVNVNGALTVCQTKLLQRSKLQPVSLKVSKGDNNRPSSGSCAQPERQTSVRSVVSASYESLTSLLPDYTGFRHSLYAEAMKASSKEDSDSREMIKRLNPDSMTDSSKRHYAWQVANGNISSQSLRTPSILPFWDSLKGTVPENNSIKLPT